LAGATLAVGLTAAAASAVSAPTGAAAKIGSASTTARGVGAAGQIRGSHPLAPSAYANVDRPAPHPASPAATPRQSVVYYGPYNVAPGTNSWVQVYCPAGMVATGGGESNTSLGGITLHGTYALSDGSGWHVDVSNGSGAGVGVTVYAVCFSGLTSYKQVTQPAIAYSSHEFRAGVDCPIGVAVGTGGWANSYDQFVAFQEAADGSAWVDFGNSLAGPSPTVQAICVQGINNYHQIGYGGGPIAPGQDGSVGGPCPAGTWLVSGGGGTGDSVTAFRVTDTYPTYSADQGQGWRVYAHNDTTLSDSVDVFLVCGT
jgi:hypothetical protein